MEEVTSLDTLHSVSYQGREREIGLHSVSYQGREREWLGSETTQEVHTCCLYAIRKFDPRKVTPL